MEILAVKQIRILLDLLEEDADIRPYLATLSVEDKISIVFVLNQLVKESQ